MCRRLEFALDKDARATLEAMRDHHRKPYMRERASAVLKVADGHLVMFVAELGLLKPHDGDTVSKWCHDYLEYGIGGLFILPGRGRKPAFSP